MYPKGSRESNLRASRPRKRKFRGNQYSDKVGEPLRKSATARKLSSASYKDIHCNPVHCYRIIEFFTVFTALSEILICSKCKNNVKFEESSNRGLGFKLVVLCRCGRTDINSGPLIDNGFEINRRIVFVMRLLGIGRDGINLFCGLMDICEGLSKHVYDRIIEHIHTSTSILFNNFCKKAVEEEQKENEKRERPINNLKVSSDDSWKKQDSSLLFGVITLIAYHSGKVIDLIVKSSYCQGCTFWKNKQNTQEYLNWFAEHEEECAANHKSSARKIEVDAVVEMFLRSEEKFKVKYGNYIGNGNSETFKGILDINLYGDDFPVVKSECIEHVQKRIDTRLRNVEKQEKLREKLSDKLIKDLSTYYGLAIRRNVSSVEKMKKDIMATYYHLCSTNKKPRHEYCPPGKDSWCKWQVAQATGDNFDHPPPFHPDLQKHLLPIYEDMSKPELLERYLGGHTQNVNESYNSVIWCLAPKHLHSGLKIVEIAAYIAAGLFNEGYSAILQIMQNLEIVIGRQCRDFAENYDEQRLKRQKRRSTTKEARQVHRQQLIEQNTFFEEAEGLLYGSEIAD